MSHVSGHGNENGPPDDLTGRNLENSQTNYRGASTITT